MNYFRLIDDVEIPGRWHLGEIIDFERVRADLSMGKQVLETDGLSATITHNGIPLDFCTTSFGVPVATKELGEVLSTLVPSGLQRLPLRIPGFSGYEILNATRTIACLDECKSEFTKWLVGDHRSDLVGQYRMVTKLMVDPSLVPQDAHFFRLSGWPVALIVSEKIKNMMEARGCFGAMFLAVS
jgi:uncharacterized protein DUF1629